MKMNKGTLLAAIGLLTLSGMRLILILLRTKSTRVFQTVGAARDPT